MTYRQPQTAISMANIAVVYLYIFPFRRNSESTTVFLYFLAWDL